MVSCSGGVPVAAPAAVLPLPLALPRALCRVVVAPVLPAAVVARLARGSVPAAAGSAAVVRVSAVCVVRAEQEQR